MDAAKFIKESTRMCNHYDNYCCTGCPAKGLSCIIDGIGLAGDDEMLENYVSIVEKWSKENPVTTNGNKIEEIFGKDILHRFENVADNTKNKALKWLILGFLNSEYKEPTKKEINNGIHEN